MSLRGFFSIFKGKDEQPDYATVNPVQRGQMALDVVSHGFLQVVAGDIVEAGSTTRVIAAAAHVAKRGDVISFTSGALQTREVAVQETTTNTITLCETLESAPATAVTFNILRHKACVIGADGTIAVSAAAGGATAAKQDTGNTSLASIDGKTPTVGQKAMAASSPVVIASDQSAVPVSGTFWQATQPVSGAFFQATQPVSAASLPLPTGAATETTLAAASAKLPATLGQKAMAASMAVALASDQSSIPVSNLPTTVATDTGASSASTLRSVLATRHEAAATPVSVRLSDGSAFQDSGKGRAYADSVRYAYSTASVTSGAWVQLIGSTAADINELLIFESAGQCLELGTGAAASETRKLIIPPGGFDSPVRLRIPSGTRVSIRALNLSTGTAGEFLMTGLT